MKPKQTLAASIALLTGAVAPVAADDEWLPLLLKDDTLTWVESFPTFTRDSFAPTAELPFNLGTPERPWHTVHAGSYTVNGNAGLTANVPLGNGCTLKIRGGLVVNVTGGPYPGACKQ